MANLKVNFCGVEMKNPVVAASGTFGFGKEFDEIYDIGVLGGVSTKGLTLEPRLGNPTPRIAEGHGVILNAVGLQNPGVDVFLKDDLDFLKSKHIAVIANVAGKTLDDYAGICEKLDGKVDMIELNISCPNVKCGGMAFGIKPESVREVTKVSKSAMKKTPLMVKLSPNVESIAANAAAAQSGGADAISLINTLTGMVVDVERRRPLIANNTGGVSGAGVKPIAVRMVWEACNAVDIPVMGMGGIATAEDALEFIIAGAAAVQVGTANFTDTLAMPKIIEGLNAWLDARGIADINELRGTLRLNGTM
ncbi:MAG TPA: dihydroorotate dehydrogenase [Candidatus Borkfalkia avistercoris]|uniref:Dihydroorotate dehydrogenase n=1 Tax=Candidatus Borkfalkia avistercoris TaxID=2838504 RepID=A0A9D2CZ46_9FIRM|nr:dihydroorotate dehydrogenase [Candidatus Borkfalkia avistercoris]